MMQKRNTIKFLSLFAMGLGFAATLLSDWTDSKEQEALIEEKVNEALAERDKREHEEDEEP